MPQPHGCSWGRCIDQVAAALAAEGVAAAADVRYAAKVAHMASVCTAGSELEAPDRRVRDTGRRRDRYGCRRQSNGATVVETALCRLSSVADVDLLVGRVPRMRVWAIVRAAPGRLGVGGAVAALTQVHGAVVDSPRAIHRAAPATRRDPPTTQAGPFPGCGFGRLCGRRRGGSGWFPRHVCKPHCRTVRHGTVRRHLA